MNIVDTRARNTFNFVKRKNIKNIPLFELSFLDYSIDISGYTDVIFQSTPSVEFFNHHKDLINKNVFAMGPGTQSSLGAKNNPLYSCRWEKSRTGHDPALNIGQGGKSRTGHEYDIEFGGERMRVEEVGREKRENGRRLEEGKHSELEQYSGNGR